MRRIDVSPEADGELENILTYSARQFGWAAAERYRDLVDQAYRDLAEDPTRPGVSSLDGIAPDLRLYPIRQSRERMPSGMRVNRTRHVVAFRFDLERVQIVRLLHDAMDLVKRLG